MRIVKFFLIIVLLSACESDGKIGVSSGGAIWKAVYKNDRNGKRISGSIDTLIAGIRAGYSVKVGWGWKKELGDSTLILEHVATPLYISIIQQKHISAIIDAHPLLESYFKIDAQKFAEGGHIWQCVMTTQGTFHAQVYDRATGALLKDWPQTHTITWFLDSPAKPDFKRTKPLY